MKITTRKSTYEKVMAKPRAKRHDPWKPSFLLAPLIRIIGLLHLIPAGFRFTQEGMEKIDSIRRQTKELRADLLKQTVKPTFSLKRTLITIGILLSVCLPLTARFIDSPVVDDVCLKLWGIVLIAFCIYFVWWLDDFVLVVSRKSDGSVEYREERMSEIKKNPYWKYT